MKKQYNLQKRILRIMNLSNAIDTFFTLVIICIFVGAMISFAGNAVTNYLAYRMSDVLSVQWEEGKEYNYENEDILKFNYFEFHRKSKELPLNNKSPNMKKNLKDEELFDEIILGIHRMIEYKIWKNDELIFDSAKEANKDNEIIEKITNKDIIERFINTNANEEIYDEENNIGGHVNVKINPKVITGIYLSIIIVIAFVLCILLFLSKIVTSILSKKITEPLILLEERMNNLAEGYLEDPSKCNIMEDKPIKEFTGLMNAFKKILAKTQEYTDSLELQNKELEAQKEELEAQNIQLEENQIKLNKVNEDLNQKTLKLSNLLENVGQGFLTIKEDQIISEEYSHACEKMFKKDISNLKLSKILYSDNIEQQNFLDEVFSKIFEEKDKTREIYMSLLPEEISINDRILQLDYKIVYDEKRKEIMMVIITDITDKKSLEISMKNERKSLKMILKVVLNREEFSDVVKEYKTFIEEKVFNDYERTLREIHNFKGDFSQYDLINIVEYLDNLENKLINTPDELLSINKKEMIDKLQEDLRIIYKYVGNDFFNEEEIYRIKRETIETIEEKVKHILPKSEGSIIIPLIKSLKFRPIKELLKMYPEYVIKLSERLNKSVKTFEIQGDDILIDNDRYQKMIKLLIHIFRNAVDHGIECEEERVETGKEHEGNILCTIKEKENSFDIIIEDDGKGIDEGLLISRALAKNIIKEEEIKELEDIKNLIFYQGMTTKEKSTPISGKGIGLAAVKEEVNYLKGNITIESEKGKGTKFSITLPKSEEQYILEQNNLLSLQNAIVSTTKKFIFDYINFDMKNQKTFVDNEIKLYKTTALINVKGQDNIMIMLSMNDKLMNELIKRILIDDIEEESLEEYREDMVREFTNTIIGNAFGELEKKNIYFDMGVQAVITNNNAKLKYLESEILISTFKNQDYEINIIMFLLNGENKFQNISKDIEDMNCFKEENM